MKPPYKITGKILKLVALISERIREVNSAHLNKLPTDLRKKTELKQFTPRLKLKLTF